MDEKLLTLLKKVRLNKSEIESVDLYLRGLSRLSYARKNRIARKIRNYFIKKANNRSIRSDDIKHLFEEVQEKRGCKDQFGNKDEEIGSWSIVRRLYEDG